MEEGFIGRAKRSKWMVPLIGLVVAITATTIIFTYPNWTARVDAVSSILLSLALVILYFQQKSIIAADYKPDLVVEGLRELEAEDQDGRMVLLLRISNIGKGQAVDVSANIKSKLNTDDVPHQEYSKNLSRQDFDLEGWLQQPGSADYIDAGERKQLFAADFTTEMTHGNKLGAMIGRLKDLQSNVDSLDADRLYLQMEIKYRDTLGREYVEPVFDYVGPFEQGIGLTEFFQRAFERDTYEVLDEIPNFARGFDDDTDAPDPIAMSEFVFEKEGGRDSKE